jgi:hypothetical protein
VLSAKLNIILKPSIYFVKTLVFPLKGSHFPPAFFHLIYSDPQHVLSLTDVLCQVVIFNDLILGGSLIMYRLALVLVSQSID